MRLSELLNLLLEGTLAVSLREDLQLNQPEDLTNPEVHAGVSDAVTEAALENGLSVRGAYAFGEWLAELCTGWSTRYNNENDILMLDYAFGEAAYGDPKQVIRLYLLPTWGALSEHLQQVRVGIKAAFEAAKAL